MRTALSAVEEPPQAADERGAGAAGGHATRAPRAAPVPQLGSGLSPFVGNAEGQALRKDISFNPPAASHGRL